MRFLEGVRESRTGGCNVSAFAAVEAKSFLGTLLMFFRGHSFWELDCVNVHGICVPSCVRRGERLEGLGGPSASLSDLFHVIPLVLEVGGFSVPVINFIWDGIKGHDLLHKQGGDSGSEEADKDVVVHDTSAGDIALECGDALQGQGELLSKLNKGLHKE